MFTDVEKIYLKAGNGGDGVVSFHTEKYVPNGGPDGGDGGRGGSIIFVADANMHTLSDYHFQKHYRAENGTNGGAKRCAGKCGRDVILKVPCGTVIKDAETGKIMADLFYSDSKVELLKGGKGGLGNIHFATSTRRAPRFSKLGEVTKERAVILELKTIADCCLVGFPNVGKSTILSVISAAKPKIANYHFTTLTPNLGVVKIDEDSFTVADIPGLIEGAAEGVGLGHDFLRHIERTRLIIHVVDMGASEGRIPFEDYTAVRKELKNYSETLYKLPEIIIANKMDLPDSEDNLKNFKNLLKKRVKILPVSGATTKGLKEAVRYIAAKIKTLPPSEPIAYEPFSYEEDDRRSFDVKIEGGVYVVYGGLVEELARNVVLSDTESFRYFQKILREKGVIDRLEEMGIEEGDTVRILDIEFEFIY